MVKHKPVEKTGVSDESQLRANDWLAVLVCWTAFVGFVTYLGIGFAGGIREAYSGNIGGILFTASPIVPLIYWLRDRKRARDHRS